MNYIIWVIYKRIKMRGRLPLLCLVLHAASSSYITLLVLWACDLSASSLVKYIVLLSTIWHL